MPKTDDTWTSGLIPLIGSESFAEIVRRVADLGIVMSPEGEVLGVFANPAFRQRDALARYQGMQLRDTFAAESVVKFEARLASFRDDPEQVRPVELNHKGEGKNPGFPVRYSFHAIGENGKILLMGRDLRAIAEMQQQLVAAQLALEKDYESRREHDMQFRVLMASVDEAMVFVSLPDGTIRDCNPAARVLLGKHGGDLVGVSLEQVLVNDGKGALAEKLVGFANENAATQIAIKARTLSRMVSLRPILFRNGGDQSMLCKITTTSPETLKSDDLQSNLTGLYERGADAIVFVDANGVILSANEAFLNLADVTHGKALKGRSIVDFLGRGNVDLNVMIESAARSGMMRAYTTRVTGEFGAERSVEVSTTHVQTGADPVFALILRDISRADNTRTETKQLGEVDMQSVIELIGSQSLRDIVAKTTDVVEKMCIETAVELTSNNRVAAAEMLGLSRQSLYVKLRKYDLL